MSWYISRTFRAHCESASKSSFFAPSRRHRSYASSLTAAGSAPVSAWSSTSFRSPAPRSRAFSRFFFSTPVDELGVLALELLAREQRVADLVHVLGDRALLGAGRLVRLLGKRGERVQDLHGGVADGLRVARGEPAVVADGGAADELPDLLRVLGRDRLGHVHEDVARELARLLERRETLLLGPVGEPTGPELVVLVEVPLLALGEVLAPARKPVLERGQGLVAVDVDALVLAAHLVLEVREVGSPLVHLDVRDDRGGEVEHLLELLGSDVEEVADAARDALEEPDVRDGGGEVDVTHPLAAHLLAGHLDAAALADDALVANPLVLPAVALPVLGRTEDALAEKAVLLGLERAVVDRLRLRDLAGGPVPDLLARREADADRVEVIDVDQSGSLLLFVQFCDVRRLFERAALLAL